MCLWRDKTWSWLNDSLKMVYRSTNYLYTVIQKGHNEFEIIDKERKEPPTTWEEQLDDILTEVIGKDWRRYDD